MSAYKVGGAHQHTPEIEQALPSRSPATSVSFTPVLAPMPRGILATVHGQAGRAGTADDDMRDVLAAAYAGEPFVHVLPAGAWPRTGLGRRLERRPPAGARRHRRGPGRSWSGHRQPRQGRRRQAVQDANLMLGLPETAGLTAIGVAPE